MVERLCFLYKVFDALNRHSRFNLSDRQRLIRCVYRVERFFPSGFVKNNRKWDSFVNLKNKSLFQDFCSESLDFTGLMPYFKSIRMRFDETGFSGMKSMLEFSKCVSPSGLEGSNPSVSADHPDSIIRMVFSFQKHSVLPGRFFILLCVVNYDYRWCGN